MNIQLLSIVDKHFNSNLGFGNDKSTAIELLKDTIQILDEFNIDYFLISGTLLGYIRHNDFIPWDDDIDLIVDHKILDKLQEIHNKYNEKITFINKQNFLLKTCLKKKIHKINNNHFNQYLLNKDDTYNWPFIDLFLFNYTNENKNKISFFKKEWDAHNFFPIKKTTFLNINVSIPNNPEYFLKINYGDDYMTILKSSSWNHKDETSNKNMNTMTLEKYNFLRG